MTATHWACRRWMIRSQTVVLPDAVPPATAITKGSCCRLAGLTCEVIAGFDQRAPSSSDRHQRHQARFRTSMLQLHSSSHTLNIHTVPLGPIASRLAVVSGKSTTPHTHFSFLGEVMHPV